MNIEAFTESANGELIHEADARYGEYIAFVRRDLPLSVDLSPQLIMDLSSADRRLGELASEGRHLPNPGLLVDPLLRREAVLSVRIEGTRTYVADLYAHDVGQLRLFGNDTEDRRYAMQEALNYENALRTGISRIESDPNRQLTVGLLCDLHEILLHNTKDAGTRPGMLREIQNWIGPSDSIEDATYVAPPPSAMRSRLMTLDSNINTDIPIPPLIRLAQIHYQFEALHPFIDGNGRLGRLLLSLLLAKWNILPQPILYLSGYLEHHRGDYFRHLRQVTEQGAWSAWFAFFLRSVRTETESTLRRIERFQELHERYRQFAASESISANLTGVIEMLFSLPLISAPRISSQLGITQPAARQHLKRLEDQGILERFRSSGRVHWYVAREILETIED